MQIQEGDLVCEFREEFSVVRLTLLYIKLEAVIPAKAEILMV